MPTLTLDNLAGLLRQYVAQTGRDVDLLLIGGLAMSAYGHPSRATFDVGGELREGVRPLQEFLRSHGIPADLGQNLSGWSVVAMPPGYQHRGSIRREEPGLRLRLLDPVDFIISKLRRGTDEDLSDAQWVAKRFRVPAEHVRTSAASALSVSPEDTALFMFERTVDRFCRDLASSAS